MSNQSTALAKRNVTELIDSDAFRKQLAEALPNQLKPERMTRLALTMLKKNSALLHCDPVSIMACVVEIAQLGLEPEGVLGHAYMVPFSDQCTLIVGYRGFMHLMYQSGVVTEVSAEIVRKGDVFKRVLGTQRGLVHEPIGIPEKDNENFWQGAYAVVHFLSGGTAFEYLEKVKIYQARARSRGYQKHLKEGKSTPWVTDAEEMWKKTVIRRLAKRMPTSTTDQRPSLLRAVMLDEYGERPGLLVPTLRGFEVNENPPDPGPDADADPIKPTEEVSNEGEKQEAVKNPEAVKKSASKSGKKAAAPANSAVPRAQIPKEDDPFIDNKEQTAIYSKAAANNWKLPDEVVAMLKKKFGVESVRLVRRSMLPKILGILESGT
jgi:recombination protein RecT